MATEKDFRVKNGLIVTDDATVGGNVGIGTESPTAQLHVLGPNFPLARIERSTTVTNGSRSTFSAIHRTSGDMVDGFGADVSFGIVDSAGVDNEIATFGAIRDGADNSGAFQFKTKNAGSLTEKLRITATGNVGIGTASPTQRLDVNGGAVVPQGPGYGWQVLNAGALRSNADGALQVSADTANAYVSSRISFDIDGSEKVRIDSSGNVGIGTTSPSQKLHVVGSALLNDGANGGVVLGNSAARKIFGGGSYAGIRFYVTTSEGFIFYTNDNVQRLSITNGGNLLPGADAAQDLGSTSLRWNNVYTTDLHLSNEAKPQGNSVDGTKGNWTIQEGEDHLYIINNKNGKKYRFALEEIE